MGILVGMYVALWAYIYWLDASVIEQMQTDSNVLLRERENIQATNIIVKTMQSQIVGMPLWGVYVEDIIRLAPATITILQLEANDDPLQLKIVGEAVNRTTVVDFERSLRQLSWVKKLDSLLQNFVSDQSVEFSFTITPQ